MIPNLTNRANRFLRAIAFLYLYMCGAAGHLHAADYYWVGGSGNWSDYANHWATGSGGVIFHTTLPGPSDNVYFDANSFTADSQYVYIDSTFAYCYNMDWAGVQYDIRFISNISNTSKLNVYGSLILNQNIYLFRSGINFAGNDTGLIINTQQVVLEGDIIFTGTGSWKQFSNMSLWRLNFLNGSFDSNGLRIYARWTINASSLTNPFVDFSGSEVSCQSLIINSNPNFNGVQSRIVLIGIGAPPSSSLQCTDHTFGSIIFENVSGGLSGKVTADSVVFFNEAIIGGNITTLNCNYLGFFGKGTLSTSIGYVSNIGYAEFSSNITYSGTNTFDTLVWNNPGINVLISGSVIVNDTFMINDTCSSMITFTGNPFGSFIKSSGVVQLEYIRLKGVHASGGATFIANNSFDLGNNTGWQINSPTARTVYWVNGGGVWSDINHWSLSSGGPGGACPPNEFDTVYFDHMSFTFPNDTVLIDNENIYSSDFNFIGVVGNPIIYRYPFGGYNFTLNVSGSFHADSDGKFMGFVTLSGSSTVNTLSNGPVSLYRLTINGPGTWSLTDDINQVQFILNSGNLNTNDFSISNSNIYPSSASVTFTLNLGSSTMFNTGANFIYMNPSNIISQNSSWIYDSNSNSSLALNKNAFNNIIFEGQGNINGSFTCNTLFIDSTHTISGDTVYAQRVELGGSGSLNGVFFIDTLIQNSSDVTMRLGKSTVLNIANYIEISGASCDEYLTLQSDSIAFIVKTTGVADFDFINLQNIHVGGGAVFNANNSIDLGGNSGWNITTPVARTLYWVGGTGNWSDPNHWSLSSGGSGGNCIPHAYDDVIIDTNSFVLPIYETIHIDRTNIYFNNFYFSSPNINDIINIDANDFINVYGSLVFSTKANFFGTYTSKRTDIILNGTATNNLIQSTGTDLERLIMNASGTYSLGDSLTCEKITFRNGIFNSNNFSINTKSTRVDSSAQAVNFGNSILYTDTLDVRYANQGFDASNAAVKFINAQSSGNLWMYSNGQEFHYIESSTWINIIGGFKADYAIFFSNVKYFNSPDDVIINKGIIHGDFIFDSNGNLVFDTLLLYNDGYIFQMYNGSTLLINNEIIVDNSASFPIQLSAYNNGTFNLEKPSGLVCMDNMIMRGVHAVGSGIFYAGANTIDLGNNTGWIYASCNPNNSDVWPGDANYDLTVDNFDVLYLGLAHGQTGPARVGASNAWVAQPASDWLYQFANGANLKNADCNGNGVVNDDDTTAISLNYGLTHPMRIQPPLVTALPSIPLFLVANPDTVILGDTVQIEVHLGTPISPVDSIYGIAFTINFDSTLIDTTYMVFDYSNSWMGVQGSNLLNFEKQFLSQGKVDVAITRTDYMNAAGDGVIVTTGVVVIDNIGARLNSAPPYISFPITLSNPRALTAAEYYLAISLSNDSVEIDTSQTVGLPDINQVSDGINIFPNPAGEYLFAHSARSQITGIEIFDMMGSTTSFDLASSMHQRLDVSGLANGVYGIKIITPAGIIKRKLVIKH